MGDKFQFFDGKKFTRDEKTGYYLCSTQNDDGIRKRMHVYVWEYYNGKIPQGCHVHHIDEDRSNNDISNLRLLPEFEHLSLHGKEKAEQDYERIIENLNINARPKAGEWHRSAEGREWHKRHYEKMKNKFYVKKKFICEQCGEEFESTKAGSRFCSNKCRAAWRRKSGVDDVKKICVDCGGIYIANKYAETKYCSICKNKKHSRNRKRRRL